MKLESFYEALRRNLNRLQPDYSNSEWERFNEEVPLPPVPIWRSRWAQAAAIVLALGLGGALVYLLYNGRQSHLEERVQQLTRQRDSLILIQPARPTSSVPLRPDTTRDNQAPYSSDIAAEPRSTPISTPEMLAAARSRPDSVSEPGTESFDAWFNSILSKKPGSVNPSASKVAKARKITNRKFTKKAKDTGSRAQTAKRVKRAVKKTTPVVARQIPAGDDAILTVERTQTLDLDPLPTLSVQSLPVQTPVLPSISLEQVQQQFGGSSGSGTSLPTPGP